MLEGDRLLRKSLYRKVMFSISSICLVLLIIIAIKIGVFSGFSSCTWFKRMGYIFNNDYFCSIICSVIAVVIIYFFQVQYSKIMLKKDVRCNEIIQNIYDGIEIYCKIQKIIPEKPTKNTHEDYIKSKKMESIMYYEFYKKNSTYFEIMAYSLSDINHDILIESLQSCFFLNLNFKLLNIVNNIKNRLPNIRNGYPKLKEMCEKYQVDEDEDMLISMGNEFSHYLIDLKFMVVYWKELLDYLNYDPTYIKLFVSTYNSQYDILEDIKQPKEVQNEREKKIRKKVRRTIWRDKIKNFWNE